MTVTRSNPAPTDACASSVGKGPRAKRARYRARKGGIALPLGVAGIWAAVVMGYAWLTVLSLRLRR